MGIKITLPITHVRHALSVVQPAFALPKPALKLDEFGCFQLGLRSGPRFSGGHEGRYYNERNRLSNSNARPLRLPWQWETHATICIQSLSCFKIQIGNRNFGGILFRKSPECLAHYRITLNFHLVTIMEYQHHGERRLFGRLWLFWRGLKGLTRLALFFAQPSNFSREPLHLV